MVSYGASVVTTDGVTRVVQFWAIQMTNGDVVLLHDMDPENDPFETTPIESVTLTHVLDTGYRMIPGYHSEPVAPACFCPGTLIATPGGGAAGRGAAHRSAGSDRRPWRAAAALDRGAAPALRSARRPAHCRSRSRPARWAPTCRSATLCCRPQHRILIADGPDEGSCPGQGVQGPAAGPAASRLPAGGISLPAAGPSRGHLCRRRRGREFSARTDGSARVRRAGPAADRRRPARRPVGCARSGDRRPGQCWGGVGPRPCCAFCGRAAFRSAWAGGRPVQGSAPVRPSRFHGESTCQPRATAIR